MSDELLNTDPGHVRVADMLDTWVSMAVVLLRNGRSPGDLARALGRVLDQVAREDIGQEPTKLTPPSQFNAVMAFLDKYGYKIHDRDDDPAYFGGHSQRALAERYDRERA